MFTLSFLRAQGAKLETLEKRLTMQRMGSRNSCTFALPGGGTAQPGSGAGSPEPVKAPSGSPGRDSPNYLDGLAEAHGPAAA